MSHSREIACTMCGRTAWARIEPVFEGFKRVGETVVCTACGHRYAGAAAAPFVAGPPRPQVFTTADKPRALDIFADDERRKSCGWCAHFVVNPFNQRCGLTNRDVQATDLCVRFESKSGPMVPEPDRDDAREQSRMT